jgi:hypothetical protein
VEANDIAQAPIFDEASERLQGSRLEVDRDEPLRGGEKCQQGRAAALGDAEFEDDPAGLGPRAEFAVSVDEGDRLDNVEPAWRGFRHVLADELDAVDAERVTRKDLIDGLTVERVVEMHQVGRLTRAHRDLTSRPTAHHDGDLLMSPGRAPVASGAHRSRSVRRQMIPGPKHCRPNGDR